MIELKKFDTFVAMLLEMLLSPVEMELAKSTALIAPRLPGVPNEDGRPPAEMPVVGVVGCQYR